MAQSPIEAAIQQICQEKNLSEESVLNTIELALAAAFRKDFGNKMQNIVTKFDSKTGEVAVTDVKTVVEDLPEEDEEEVEIIEEDNISDIAYISDDKEEKRKFNPKTEIQEKDAKEINKKYKIGDQIITELEVPGEFGRMAAQTAKQVIIQKLREKERENIFEEFKTLEHQVVNGTIHRKEGRNIIVDLGQTTGVMPQDEAVFKERYNIGNRMRFYIKSVEQTSRGPQILLSRVSQEIVRKIFENEIPEVANDVIDIKSIAREAGERSKIAIFTNDENVDPIGSCVGQKGSRIQTVINELNGEKIDIILWDENPIKFIINSLSPAKVSSVDLKEGDDEYGGIAVVTVKEDQLSLAIGRGGQNVRLASRLTGWKLDIVSETGEKVNISDGNKDKLAGDAEESENSEEEKETKSQKTKKKTNKEADTKVDTETEE